MNSAFVTPVVDNVNNPRQSIPIQKARFAAEIVVYLARTASAIVPAAYASTR